VSQGISLIVGNQNLKKSLLVKEREVLLPSMNHIKPPKYIQIVELYLCSSYVFLAYNANTCGCKYYGMRIESFEDCVNKRIFKYIKICGDFDVDDVRTLLHRGACALPLLLVEMRRCLPL